MVTWLDVAVLLMSGLALVAAAFAERRARELLEEARILHERAQRTMEKMRQWREE